MILTQISEVFQFEIKIEPRGHNDAKIHGDSLCASL